LKKEGEAMGVPNVAMMISGGRHNDLSRRAEDVRPIMIDNIEVKGRRQRSVDRQKVEQLAESIKLLGLLQPIGVKRQKSGEPFLLIYGAHRLEAKMLLRESDPTQDVIGAVIYPSDMPDWAILAAEVAENLCRKELSPKERDAHTAIYAGLLKQNGEVVEGRTAQGQAKSAGVIGPKSLGSNNLTVTRKTAADLGITDEAVRNRIRNASKIAVRHGVAVDKPTPEKMSGEKLIEVGQAALKAAEADKAEAARTGRSGRYVNPQEPLKDTAATVRLDVTNPQPFIDWCRKRIDGKHKPMSLNILKAYASALASLIKEVEASEGDDVAIKEFES
jgi:hypothetical protein